jgi:hypothetical protein
MTRATTVGAVALIALLLGVGAGGAYAQDNAGIDQYTENVPGAGGDDHSGGGGSGGAGGSGGSGGGDEATGTSSGSTAPSNTVSPATSDELQAAGPDGQAAEALAESAGPQGGGSTSSGTAGSSSGAGSGSGAVTADLSASTDDSSGLFGLGPGLPIVLGLTLLAALGIALVRRRADNAGTSATT